MHTIPSPSRSSRSARRTRCVSASRPPGNSRRPPSGSSTTRQLIRELTDRRREVLAEAVRQGYFRNPRGATHEDIAAELSCSASVVGQHLRRIETTLVTAIVPTFDGEVPAADVGN